MFVRRLRASAIFLMIIGATFLACDAKKPTKVAQKTEETPKTAEELKTEEALKQIEAKTAAIQEMSCAVDFTQQTTGTGPLVVKSEHAFRRPGLFYTRSQTLESFIESLFLYMFNLN